jgi:hypothetical protein
MQAGDLSMPVSLQRQSLKIRLREFTLPPIGDGLVLGRDAPVGCSAFRKALSLLVAYPYEHIELDDDIISDILVRQAILRRAPREFLVEFVLKHIKPRMGSEEVLHLDIDAELVIEGDAL